MHTRRAFLSTAAAALAAPPSSKPNIVFILADDIGYGDLSCYGAQRVQTPNIDRLAREGVRFTDAHSSASVCTPTRYAAITGQYAWRNTRGDRILSGEAPLSFSPSMPTVPSILKRAGYSTGLVGKWHLGLGDGNIDWNSEIRPGPLDIGFDSAYFFSATNDRLPSVYIDGRRVVGLDPADPLRTSYKGKIGNEPTGGENPEGLKLKVLTHDHDGTIVDGISRIGWQTGGKKAWWKDETMADVFDDRAVRFIEQNRQHPFYLFFASHNIHQPRWPNPRYRGKTGCGLRCDTIAEFDNSVGRVLATLDRLKLADNTIVIVSSDNGPMLDDGYLGHDVRDANGHVPAGPWRGTKGSLYEGGHRVPFLARWPGRIKPATESAELLCLVDLMATFAAASGQRLNPGDGPDSVNMLPALTGEKLKRPIRDYLVLQSNAQWLAIRQGDWKLITARANQPAQLFNLKSDPAETKDLAPTHPDKAKELSALLERARSSPQTRPT